MLVSEMIEMLQKNYDSAATIAVDIWTKEEVLEITKGFVPRIEVDSGTVDSILAYVERKLDSNIGITWDSMREACLEVIDPIRRVYTDEEQSKKEDEAG